MSVTSSKIAGNGVSGTTGWVNSGTLTSPADDAYGTSTGYALYNFTAANSAPVLHVQVPLTGIPSNAVLLGFTLSFERSKSNDASVIRTAVVDSGTEAVTQLGPGFVWGTAFTAESWALTLNFPALVSSFPSTFDFRTTVQCTSFVSGCNAGIRLAGASFTYKPAIGDTCTVFFGF